MHGDGEGVRRTAGGSRKKLTAVLEWQDQKRPPPGPELSLDAQEVQVGLLVMGGSINWAAIEYAAEVAGVDHVETWLFGMRWVEQWFRDQQQKRIERETRNRQQSG